MCVCVCSVCVRLVMLYRPLRFTVEWSGVFASIHTRFGLSCRRSPSPIVVFAGQGGKFEVRKADKKKPKGTSGTPGSSMSKVQSMSSLQAAGAPASATAGSKGAWSRKCDAQALGLRLPRA